VTHLRQIMRNYAPSTIHAYIRTVEHFARHFHCPPDRLGPKHIRQYQAAMFRDWKLAPSTATQRLAALRFLYIQVLKRGWSAAETPYPKKVLHLPEILSQQEVARLIDATETSFQRILVMTLDATGARRAEVARLKISDIDSQRMVVHIRGGKGRKDRDVMLSATLLQELRRYWRGLRHKPTVWLFPGNSWHRAVRLPPRCCGQSAGRRRSVRVWSTSIFIRTRCATASRHTCSKRVPICALSRSCSDIVTSKRPPSIFTSPTSI
jgi:integrase/recombinase XerD